jgi:eukaryotic-like serine/threonine-protein kinase
MADIPQALAAALQDRYLLERELGRGGMATVYLTQDLPHDRSVALKVLHPELAQTLGPDRFHREIEVAARRPRCLHEPARQAATSQMGTTFPSR